jgi:hypothetical protein
MPKYPVFSSQNQRHMRGFASRESHRGGIQKNLQREKSSRHKAERQNLHAQTAPCGAVHLFLFQKKLRDTITMSLN